MSPPRHTGMNKSALLVVCCARQEVGHVRRYERVQGYKRVCGYERGYARVVMRGKGV